MYPASSPIVTPRYGDDLEADGRPKPIKFPVIFQLVDVPPVLNTLAGGFLPKRRRFRAWTYRNFSDRECISGGAH
jgi:hypothetical protein